MEISPLRRTTTRLAIALAALALVQLACFTSKKTLLIRADGSGEVRSEAAVPEALGAEIDRAGTAQRLIAERWTDVAFSVRTSENPACTLSTEQQTTAIAAFEALMPVFGHPNCANCHGAVANPYAQDTNHPGGAIEPGQTCAECHVQADETGPGSWRLAPQELAFAGRTAEQICTQVKGFHTSPNGFIGHMEADRLVGFGFSGESAGAADTAHPHSVSWGDALALATAWRNALGLEPGARYWPGGQASACGCASVDPIPLAASGVSDVVSATYPFEAFSLDVAAAAIDEFAAVEYTAIGQADGSVVYSFSAEADMTEIQQAWDEVVEVWTAEGLDPEEAGGEILGPLFEGSQVFTAEEVRAMIDAYGEPHVEVVVVVPGDFTQAASGWANSEALLSGGSDSAVFSWRPGSPALSELSLVRVARPPVDEGAGEQRVIDPESVFDFAMALPWRVPALGVQTPAEVSGAAESDDVPTSFLTQIETLRLLDAARRSSDPAVYTQLEGLTYAPVRLSGLVHRAVVVFPTGTDWRTTGVVLDPWIAAYPAGTPIAAWAGSVWASDGEVAPEVDPILGAYYPQAGGGLPAYPPDVQRDDARPLPEAGAYARSLFVRGPVSVLVVLPDGRHIGEPTGGGFVNHLRGEAEMFKRTGAPGAYDWWTFLPDTGYRVEIYARDAGELEVLAGSSGFDIGDLRPGELLTFAVDPGGTPGPVTRTGGEQAPDSGLDPDGQPAAGDPGETGAPAPAGRFLMAAGFSCLVVLGLALMVLSGIGLARRGRLR